MAGFAVFINNSGLDASSQEGKQGVQLGGCLGCDGGLIQGGGGELEHNGSGCLDRRWGQRQGRRRLLVSTPTLERPVGAGTPISRWCPTY